MTPDQFCHWLKGYIDIAAPRTAPTSEEWNVIKAQLDQVFLPKFPPGQYTPPITTLPLPSTSPPPWNTPPFNPLPWVGGGEPYSLLPTIFPQSTSEALGIGKSFSGKIGGFIPKAETSFVPAIATVVSKIECIHPECKCDPMNPDCANNGINWGNSVYGPGNGPGGFNPEYDK